MSYPFSKESMEQWMTVHPKLQELFMAVSEDYDCKIMEGHRGQKKQDEYFFQGLSKVRFPDSKHNSEPSLAVDAGPYPIKWPDEHLLKDMTAAEKEQIARLVRWYHFIGFVCGMAAAKGIEIRSGADWNQNNDFEDQKFKDLPHFELRED